MPSGKPITDVDRTTVMRLVSLRRYSRQQIADLAHLDKHTVVRIIEDVAISGWAILRHSHLDELSDRSDPHG